MTQAPVGRRAVAAGRLPGRQGPWGCPSGSPPREPPQRTATALTAPLGASVPARALPSRRGLAPITTLERACAPVREWLDRRCRIDCSSVRRRQRRARRRRGTSEHPDRNAQFENLDDRSPVRSVAVRPMISVDAEKKELVGHFRNVGSHRAAKALLGSSACPTSPSQRRRPLHGAPRREGRHAAARSHALRAVAFRTLAPPRTVLGTVRCVSANGSRLLRVRS